MQCAKFEETWIKTGPRSSHICSTGVFKHHPRMNQTKRESVVDSGASKHMLSRRDVNSEELETVHVSRTPTTVITASGEVQTNEDATRDLDLFLTVQLLGDTPPTIFRGHLREDHGVAWKKMEDQTPNLIHKWLELHWFSWSVEQSFKLQFDTDAK